MIGKSLPLFLLTCALAACGPAQETATPQPPFITTTPTLFTGSPMPQLDTPIPGETAAPGPLPTFTPLTRPTPSGSSDTYAVVLIAGDDVLNIRSGPGVENAVVGTLQPDQSGLTRTDKTSGTGEETWVEIQNPGGGTGWVDAKFLTEYVDPSAFCSDARVTSLLNDFEKAVKTTSGDLFKTLVSPAHGLDVVYIRDGTVANYSPDEAGWAFQSTYEVDWGPSAGSGQPVKGTFPGVILPALQEVFQNVTLACDQIKLGGASYQVTWPVEYANINFYSLYNPGTSQNSNMDWRTWLAGVEYVDGHPYLFALLNYQWEP
jgi:hypothetical protein